MESDMESLHSGGPCECPAGQCAHFIEPDIDCIMRRTGDVRTQPCPRCSPNGGHTWHQDGRCLSCERKDPPMSDPALWCIHIPGPDEVHARADREDAERAAAEHNAALKRFAARQAIPFDTDEWKAATAVVIPWPGTPESHAADLRRNIEEECRGSA